MSKISLSPNASGTGTFTIASPNSSTDRTLTLPDATGTINTSGAVNEVPAGTASAPSIFPTGDTNTGIFFSAADTIDFTEGGVACGQFDSSANFKFNSGYGSVATAYGCRAWAKFSNIGVIANSGNVSSVTKNGTGNYAVNFTTAMPDLNYSAVAIADIGGWNTGATQTGDYQTTSIGIQSRNLSMTATDATVSVAVFR